MENLGINAEIAKVYSFAFQQNQYPLITSLELNSSKVNITNSQKGPLTKKNAASLLPGSTWLGFVYIWSDLVRIAPKY